MRERPLTEFLSSEKTTERKENPAKRKEVKGPWELPEGWRWVRLKDVVSELKPGFARNKKHIRENGIPHLRPNNISIGKLELETIVKVAVDESFDVTQYYLKKGDILFNNTNSIELVGRAAIVSKELKYAYSNHITRIRVNKESVIPEWIVFVINYLWMQGYFKKVCTHWVGQAGVNTSTLKNIPIPLPPLSEQKRIVAKLDELNKRIEEAKRLAREAREEAERLMASALHEVFSKAEEKGWEWEKLSELVSLESGSRPKGGVKEIKQGIPSLGAEHLRWDGSFNFKNIRFVPIEFYNSLKKGKIRMSDILLVKDGATTGKVAFVGKDFPFEKACVNEHLFILRKKKSAPDFAPKFLFYALMSPQIQNEIRFLFSGSAQGGINQRFAKFLDVPLPPLEEQKRIVAYLDSIHERAQKLVKLYEEREKELEKLFPAVLDRAFRGEL